ncbi:MAG: DUF1800 family protein [Acidobacteria bacterium]|nr:DUF1800 family protein [Acidobacteriota bacterium]
MRNKTAWGFALALLLAGFPVLAARAKKKDAQFHTKLIAQQKIVHALNRLTFGLRPGDVERVRKTGLKKWIDQQLHPDQIAENPVLEAKLRPLDSLRMSTAEMAKHYPPPQVIRAMARGRVPFPDDPEECRRMERLAQRFKRRLDGQPAEPGAGTKAPPQTAIARLFSPEQARKMRAGTPEERLQLFFSLPDEQQEALLEVLPGGARRDILVKAPVEQREVLRTMLESAEFWSQGAYRVKVKSPLEMVASAVRALNADVETAFPLGQQIAQLGAPLYRKQEPTGYPNASEEWVNTTALLARMNFAQALAAGKLPGVRVDVARLGKQDPLEIACALVPGEISGETRAAISKGEGTAPQQVAGLVIGSPDFQRR